MTLKTWHTVGGITLISALTVLLQIPSDTWMTSAALSLIAGAASLACMASACILASRWAVVEACLGGLDRVYETHKWLGVWALIFAVYHFIFKAKFNTWDMLPIIELSKYWTRMVRQLSIVALVLIILLSLNRNIRYSIWRWWHKLSGPLFVIVILHWLSFESPITLSSPAGLWLTLLCSLGVLAAAYQLFLYSFVASGGAYRVCAVQRSQGTIHLELQPTHKGFHFLSGQFAFLSFKEKGLREPHPFSIASAQTENGHLHFVIRALGDYTKRLHDQVKVGMLVDVRAPHGRFKRDLTAKREIWIGAGVGITPFISWLKDHDVGNFERVQLIYCFDPQRAFPTLERIQELADQAQVQLIPNPSGGTALNETLIQSVQDMGAEHIQIYFCGPKGLLAHVKKLMQAQGIPAKNIHYELFEFR